VVIPVIAFLAGVALAIVFFKPAPPRDEYIRGLEVLLEEAATAQEKQKETHRLEIEELSRKLETFRKTDRLLRTEIDAYKSQYGPLRGDDSRSSRSQTD